MKAKIIEYKGKKYSPKELSLLKNIKYSTLINRLHKGMSVKEAIETPIYAKRNKPKYKYNDKLYYLSELMKFTNLSRTTVEKRLRQGWEVEDALTKSTYYRKEQTEPYFKDTLDLEKMISNGMKRSNPYEPLETGLGKGVLKCKNSR